jgi:hypothetical protein
LPGEFPYASYLVAASAVSAATANSHLLQVMAGGTNLVRIRRISLEQGANATTAAAMQLQVLRLTTAGTGGTAVTPRPANTADSASGATAMTLATAKGTEGVILIDTIVLMRQAILATGAQADRAFVWEAGRDRGPIVIAAGTTNGIALKNVTAIAGATVSINLECVETSF